MMPPQSPGFLLPAASSDVKTIGSVAGTLGDELAATLCDECCLGLLVALDDSSRFDGKLSTICNIYPSLEEISAFLQSLLACEDEFLVAVANLCSVGVFLAICAEENVVASLQATIGCPLVNTSDPGFGEGVGTSLSLLQLLNMADAARMLMHPKKSSVHHCFLFY